MTERETTIQRILSEKIIAILRGVAPERIISTVKALQAGGIRLVEVTFDQRCPEAAEETLRSIRLLRDGFGDTIGLGAGTVVSVAQAEAAAEAGARYMISPNVNADVIRRTRQLGLVSIPGALTPTEMLAAYEAGADFVKLFPAGVLGTGYVKAVRAPLGQIPVLAVGGVNADNMESFFRAGAVGVGVGGNLADPAAIAAGEYEKITAAARAYTEKMAR